MNPEYILALADPRATLETVGGKGASLARMMGAGLPVPDGFHITTDAYRQFVAENALQPRILEAMEAADPAIPATLETAAQQIHALFVQGEIPGEIAEAIKTTCVATECMASPLAVRSSATAEDLPGASFAGQQETFLNIQDIPALLNAVKACWASLWTARAIGYRARQGIAPEDVALAIVVQQLIPADVAGVMFTANPLNGQRNQTVINATWGLGESIVSGRVTPDSFTVEKNTHAIVERCIATKHVLTARTERGVEERPVPELQRSRATLSDDQVAELAELGKRIEELYGMPMDIEWTLLNGEFAVVQARPITVLPEPVPEPPTHWPVPDPKAFTYRGSIIELLPDPLTPLFATLGCKAINAGTLRLFSEIVGRDVLNDVIFVTVNGYAYYSLRMTVKFVWRMFARLSVLLPMFIHGDKTWREEAAPRYRALVERLQSRPMEAYPATELLDNVAQIVAEAVNIYNIYQSGVISLAMLTEMGFELLYKFIKRRNDPPALTFLVGMDSAPIRAEKSLYDVAQWCRERPELAEYLSRTPTATLVAQLETGQAPEGIAAEDWRGWQARFRAHLAQHGHAVYDLDFAKPTAVDDPGPLLETCKMYLANPGGGPYERQQKQIAQREAAVQAISGRIKGLRLKWFNKLLDWVLRYVPMREDALNDIGLGYPLLRRMLHELGWRLAERGAIATPDDVYWLTETEAREAAAKLDGSATPAAAAEIIRERKSLARAQKQVTPPSLLPERSSSFLSRLYEKIGPARSNPATGKLLKGVGASPGCVTGPARVLHSAEEFGDMQPGEVLVAAITTPAWTPLFAMASAIVTDVGGPLSHGSIVAREYGIPAVLGTGSATRRIHTGQTITVDGSAGVVKLDLP
ncbi:MAG: phosphoenolpyruvate synthase [Anaerolineae bacterium]|nr:phosphoenolpyruvate synthase [Anaerolineae bacterium]